MPGSPKNSRNRRNRAPISSTRRSGPRRNRRNSAGLFETIKTANRRAHQRTNHRNFTRRGLKSVNASVSEGMIEDYTLPTSQLIFRSIIGILLLFPCFISTIALFQIDNTTLSSSAASTGFWDQLLSQPELRRLALFFTVGIFLMLGWFYSQLLKSRFLYLYILGHELTHAFFIYLCGGRVSEFKVTKEGGHVVTNKTNILIALSPYFIPFWSVIILGISLILECFTDIPYHSDALYLLIGASWTFHLSWTLWMIPRDQPDLKENGTFFSLTIIYLANVILLATMLCLAPNGFSFKNYCYQWINLATENIAPVYSWFKDTF